MLVLISSISAMAFAPSASIPSSSKSKFVTVSLFWKRLYFQKIVYKFKVFFWNKIYFTHNHQPSLLIVVLFENQFNACEYGWILNQISNPINLRLGLGIVRYCGPISVTLSIDIDESRAWQFPGSVSVHIILCSVSNVSIYIKNLSPLGLIWRLNTL